MQNSAIIRDGADEESYAVKIDSGTVSDVKINTTNGSLSRSVRKQMLESRMAINDALILLEPFVLREYGDRPMNETLAEVFERGAEVNYADMGLPEGARAGGGMHLYVDAFYDAVRDAKGPLTELLKLEAEQQSAMTVAELMERIRSAAVSKFEYESPGAPLVFMPKKQSIPGLPEGASY